MLFEIEDERRRIDALLAAVGDGPNRLVGLALGALGHRNVVAVVHRRGLALGADADGADEVEPKAREIDDVVFGQALLVEVRVDEAKATEAPLGSTQSSEIRQVELGRIANDDVVDLAASRDKHADLPARLVADLRHRFGELGCEQFVEGHAAPIEALKGVGFRWAEARCIAVKGQCLRA